MTPSLTEILHQDILHPAALAVYGPPGPHYVWRDGAPEKGDDVRCVVPLLDLEKVNVEVAMSRLLAAVAADDSTVRMFFQEDWVHRVRDHFDCVDLSFAAIVKHPSVKVSAPNVRVVESPLLPTGSFYCVTTPECLGAMPTKEGFAGLLIGNTVGFITVMLLQPSPQVSGHGVSGGMSTDTVFGMWEAR